MTFDEMSDRLWQAGFVKKTPPLNPVATPWDDILPPPSSSERFEQWRHPEAAVNIVQNADGSLELFAVSLHADAIIGLTSDLSGWGVSIRAA